MYKFNQRLDLNIYMLIRPLLNLALKPLGKRVFAIINFGKMFSLTIKTRKV